MKNHSFFSLSCTRGNRKPFQDTLQMYPRLEMLEGGVSISCPKSLKHFSRRTQNNNLRKKTKRKLLGKTLWDVWSAGTEQFLSRTTSESLIMLDPISGGCSRWHTHRRHSNAGGSDCSEPPRCGHSSARPADGDEAWQRYRFFGRNPFISPTSRPFPNVGSLFP